MSLIPPVNASGSYYDGMNKTIDVSFGVEILTIFSPTDLVYMHMDLNTRVRYSELGMISHPTYEPPDTFYWSIPSLAPLVRTRLRTIAQEPMRIYWRVTVLELDNWSLMFLFLALKSLMGCIDAPDFYESSFWKDSDPKSGLGGWGDPNADFSVPDGGFNEFHLSYPSPHTLRRNFTLLAFDSPFLPAEFFPEPLKEANVSISAAAIETVLETPAGDYKNFQAGFEAFEVRT